MTALRCRRQVQFFFFKILSQMHSHLNFLAVAPAVRFSYNGEYFPLSEKGSGGCLHAKARGCARGGGRFRDPNFGPHFPLPLLQRFGIAIRFSAFAAAATLVTGMAGAWYSAGGERVVL
jgi:hypothetical protein